MVHQFKSYEYYYWKGDKPIFVQSEEGKRWAKKIRRRVSRRYSFSSSMFHLREGSHIRALHLHRPNGWFCRIDLLRFFYSIRRNRLKRALRGIGVPKPESLAKWSTVKNPFEGEGYVLPYGFSQSPLLATLVLERSVLGSYLRNLDPKKIIYSVYMDDICLSSSDEQCLGKAYEGLVEAVSQAGFTLNKEKTREPSQSIDAFNCVLERNRSEVLQARIDQFYAFPRSYDSQRSFDAYVDIVGSKGWLPTRKRKRIRYLLKQANSRQGTT